MESKQAEGEWRAVWGELARAFDHALSHLSSGHPRLEELREMAADARLAAGLPPVSPLQSV
jgi:hypothetical protein